MRKGQFLSAGQESGLCRVNVSRAAQPRLIEISGAAGDDTASEVALEAWIAEPGAQVLQRRKRMLDLDERRRSLALRQILKQFGRPGRIGAAVSGSDNAAHDLAVEEEIIGARRELDEAIGHDEPLADVAWSSIHAWVIAMATITRTGPG